MRIVLASIFFAATLTQPAMSQSAEETALFLLSGLKAGDAAPNGCGKIAFSEEKTGSISRVVGLFQCKDKKIKFSINVPSKCVFEIENGEIVKDGGVVAKKYEILDFNKMYIDEKNKVALQAADKCAVRSEERSTQSKPTESKCIARIDDGNDFELEESVASRIRGMDDFSGKPRHLGSENSEKKSILNEFEVQRADMVLAAKRHMKTFCEGVKRRVF